MLIACARTTKVGVRCTRTRVQVHGVGAVRGARAFGLRAGCGVCGRAFVGPVLCMLITLLLSAQKTVRVSTIEACRP